MYKHVMIPTDGSELSARAVEAGLQLAACLGAQVTAMTVSEPFHTLSLIPSQVEYTPAAYKRHAQEAAQRILGEVRPKAEAASVACDTVWVEHEHPYMAIIDTARSRNCDLVAMASHGRHGGRGRRSRQPDGEGADPRHDSGDRLSLTRWDCAFVRAGRRHPHRE
jgi:nucleotide-binding universal stress UspA family protein